ncbi:P-loop NTPase fold protein [Aquimarina aquimarini]|uniref:P-loop NTPase fold protein n=1 Tax=Aquimarina aquimarini TaxID=1191734 RepID=UPI000D54CF46|nr:P-loop NTPase fold protein [Aquimarina aquimarini]
MNQENIISVFNQYIEANNTQYAILINGGWGTGKTFFWKEALVPIIEQKNIKPLYISLNGIKSIEALQRQLFIKLVPYIGNDQNKVLKTITTFSGNLINSASKALIKVDPSDLFQGVGVDNFSFSNKFICFDDFERCQIPMKELLGFINGFVEHKYLKCLVLADEEKIFDTDSNQKVNYYNIKEKVIGRVFNYKPELKSVLPILFNKYEKDQPFFIFLKGNQTYIYKIFNEQIENNIRIISFFIDCLSNIYSHIIEIDKELKKEVLFLTAILSIEFKRGFLKSNEAQDYKDLGNTSQFWYQNIDSDLLIDNDEKPEKKKSYIEIFFIKYISNRLDDYHFYESIYTYILSGYLDVEKLLNELEKRKPEQLTEENKAFENLMSYNFRILNDEEFIKLTTKVLSYLEKGAYSIYSYERLFSFYHFFSEKGLIDYTPKEVEQKLFAGIEIAAKQKEIDRRFYENMIHFEVSDPIVQPIREKIMALHKILDQEEVQKESYLLLDVLEEGDYEKLNNLFKSKKYNKEFIAYLDGKELFKILNECSNQFLTIFTNEIKDRYNHNGIKKFYPNDQDCLNPLLELIQKHLEDEALPVLRKFLWKEMELILKNTCETLRIVKE